MSITGKAKGKGIIKFNHNKLKGELFDYSTESPIVRMAITRLFQQKKMKNEVVDNYVIRRNVINEGDLLLTMFEIIEEAQKTGIDIRKA